VELAAAAEPDVEAPATSVPRQALAKVEQVQPAVDVAAERGGTRVRRGDFTRRVGELARHVQGLSQLPLQIDAGVAALRPRQARELVNTGTAELEHVERQGPRKLEGAADGLGGSCHR
jgi:hypothetical protein